MTNAPAFLRKVLLVDAVSSAAMGALFLLATDMLVSLLGLPAGLMRWAGVILLVWSLAVGYLALFQVAPRAGVWLVVAINALWVVESLLLPALGWIQPTRLGLAFVLLQAATVALFAILQATALRSAASRDGRLAQPTLAAR